MLAGAPWQSDCREAEPWQSCWPGRCGGADGRECHGEEDCGTVAESHLEDAAGRGAAAKSYREDVAGRGAAAKGGAVARGCAVASGCAVAEILLPGRAIGKKMLAGDALADLLLAGHLRKRHLLPTSIKQERAILCGYPLLYLHYVKLSDCQQRHW